MVFEGASPRRRGRQLGGVVAAILAASGAPREALSQPITPSARGPVDQARSSGRREPETIPLFPRPPPPGKALETPLATRDAALGLGASGQIVAAVHGVALDQAPRNGRGILRVLLDENGRVSRVTSTSPSWDRAALAMQRALGGRQFELPRGVRNVVLSFDVVARSTQVPAVLTGEESQAPTRWPQGVQGRSPSDAPAPVVLVPIQSLLPLPRHIVEVTLLQVEHR